MSEDLKYSKDGIVVFRDSDHSYRLVDSGERFKSVTQTIHGYAPEFDPTGEITERFAINNELSVEEVKEYWRIDNHLANVYGTYVHNTIEKYLLTGDDRIKSKYRWIIEQFKELKFEGKLFPEKLLYSTEYMIAGQCDLTEVMPDGSINIWDYKTNKELLKHSEFNTFMLGDLWYLSDCNFNHYQIQLSIYAKLYQLKGIKVNKLNIIYFNRYLKRMEIHECKFMNKEVDIILRDRLKEIS